MRRNPLKSKAGGSARNQIVKVVSRPAPIRGLNSRDSIAGMDVGYALKLLNWFPTTGDCVIREGCSDHKTGFGGGTAEVETLAVYNAMDGTSEMFGITDAGIFDATAAGAVGATVLARTEARHQYVNFGDGTSNWLILVNGVDKPAYYDGTTWTAVDGVTSPALTGLTSTDIIHVNMFKGRLFFIQKDSMSFWYLAAGAAGGALTEFDLSSILSRGGYLMWMGTWSRDGGSGPDDHAVFMSSEGQVAIYSGTNPSSAVSWSLVGTFDLGRPLSRRGYLEFNGDLIVMTENGIFPMSIALQSEGKDEKTAITDKINGSFNDAVIQYRSNFGWEMIAHPAKTALLCNIPHGSGVSGQFVMNTGTKAWCEFDSWNANSFAVMNGLLYFGMTGKVRLAWEGRSDAGTNIVANGKTAFDYMGAGGGSKRFGMYRPVLRANGSISFLTDIDVDFKDDAINGIATYTSASASVYGTGTYGTAIYGGELEIIRQWTSPNENIGFCAAGKVKISTGVLEVRWVSNDYTFESGGVL